MRNYWMIAVVVATASLLGCKGCGDPCDDVACAGDAVCVEGECVAQPGDDECDPECQDGEVCSAGVCIGLDEVCTERGEECDPSLPTAEPFVCLDVDGPGPRPGECSLRCGPDGACDPGSLCFYLTTADDEACATNDDCPDTKECVDGTCLASVCRLSECEGFLSGQTTCENLYFNFVGFERGAQCYNLGNDARFCYPAGAQSIGDACVGAIDAIVSGDFQGSCLGGLVCVDDQCRPACSDDEGCTGDDTCLLEDEDFVDVGVGVCGAGCTPFGTGECGADETCIPVGPEEGLCIPAGDAEAFESCTPGAGDCVDGTVCIPFQQGPPALARCQPICNVTVGEPAEDGSVGEFAQSQRDATCPTGAEPVSWFRVANLAELGSGIDLYIDDEQQPLVSALGFEATSGDWISLTPGTHQIKVLPQGAPRTDVPLDEVTISPAADVAVQLVVLPVFGVTDEVTVVETEGTRGLDTPAATDAIVRVVHALADAQEVDVVLVPTDDDLADPGNQILVVENLAAESISAFGDVPAGTRDLLVFSAGDPRNDRATALVDASVTLDAQSAASLAVRGTVDPDDAYFAGVTVLPILEAPAAGAGGPTFTCVDLSNGVYGFCQENCGSSADTFGGDFCSGENTGCHPTYLQANFEWANLCSPLGSKQLDEPCNPGLDFSECGEGLYCLEYGNTSQGFDPANRGRCTSYCVRDEPANPLLSCGTGQSCQRIASSDDFEVGRCGFECEPDQEYTDTSCPDGLQSCKPTASLRENPADPDRPPDPVVDPSYCAASGDISVDEECFGNDCSPGSECMFPRSTQSDFTSTLASQYFGGPGLVPTCRAQCDPFEGDSSSTQCAADETCLFNFPWSAEVGHCAPIAEERSPLDGCEFPGESCGVDSICVANGPQNVCFQFCQYQGPNPAGELVRETCGSGLVCAPLVADIGVCL